MTTGQLIKQARKEAGLTQSELADKLEVPYQSISQWERDIRNPKFETLQKIARALEVDVGTFFTDREREISEFSDADGWFRAIEYYNITEKEYYIDLSTKFFEKYGYSFSVLERTLVNFFANLNTEGQQKAVERVEELMEIPKYQKEKAPSEGD